MLQKTTSHDDTTEGKIRKYSDYKIYDIAMNGC